MSLERQRAADDAPVLSRCVDCGFTDEIVDRGLCQLCLWEAGPTPVRKIGKNQLPCQHQACLLAREDGRLVRGCLEC